MTEPFERAAGLLAKARSVLVSTGAGMSKESGIPTFRDAREGLWAEFDPQELATPEGFRRDPRRVWGWYAWRRSRVAQAVPHPGYHALVRLEQMVPSVVVVTQNVDGLHAAAGSADVVELHGSIRRAKCLDHGHPWPGDIPDAGEGGDPPVCASCGSPLRPDVVWFGEYLPPGAIERARDLAARSDVLLLVGTSGTVWPAAELPLLAHDAGRPVIEVNPEPSELSYLADLFLQGPAGEVLPGLVEAVAALSPRA